MPGAMGWAVTFFTDYAAATKREALVDLADLVRRIETATAATKEELPWLKFARFGDLRTEKNSLRHDANMLAVTGVELDYDNEIISVDEALERLGAAGVLSVVYTSPRHSEDTPRWRVLCPFSQEYAPGERDRFLARLNGLLGGVASNESWTRSQSYYYGSVNNNPSHRVVSLEGTPLDLIDELDMFARGKPEKPKPNGINGAAHHGPATPPEAITDRRINGLIQALLDNIRRAPDGAKYFTLRDISFTVGGYLHLTSWSEAEAVEACVAALPSAEDWNAARRTAAAAIAAGRLKPLDLPDRPGHTPRAREPGSVYDPAPPVGDPIADVSRETPDSNTDLPGGDGDPPEVPPVGDPEGPGAGPPLPTIICAKGDVPRMLREAIEAMLAAGVEVYQRHALVRPIEEEYDAADGRKTHTAALLAFTAPTMFKLLCRVADWVKWNVRKNEYVRDEPPDKLVNVLLADRGAWPFPSIRGVLTCPTLRPDGSILAQRGYDPASRYYLAFPSNLVMPNDMPEAPTRQDAEAALARQDKLLAKFPFVDQVSKAVAHCILMTQPLRCAMECSPLLAVSANAPGSGKSFLVDLASAIALGRPCPIIPPGKNDEETEKGLRTKLLSGTPAFSIDNVYSGINLPLLNMATERTHISIRLFGVLEEVEVENSVVVYQTGNNLPIVDEQGRRTMRCQIDVVGDVRPEFRVFDVNPIDTVMADRGRYVADVLIIARAYAHARASGEPRPDIPPMGDSHKAWSQLVREPLVWLGCEDPIKSQEISRQSDPVANTLGAVIDAWHAAFGMEEHTLAEAVKYATTPPVMMADYQDRQQHAINEAAYFAHKEHQETLLTVLRDGFAAGKDGVDSHKWGIWMRRFEGRQSGGLRFVRAKDQDGKPILRHSTNVWKLSQ